MIANAGRAVEALQASNRPAAIAASPREPPAAMRGHAVQRRAECAFPAVGGLASRGSPGPATVCANRASWSFASGGGRWSGGAQAVRLVVGLHVCPRWVAVRGRGGWRAEWSVRCQSRRRARCNRARNAVLEIPRLAAACAAVRSSQAVVRRGNAGAPVSAAPEVVERWAIRLIAVEGVPRFRWNPSALVAPPFYAPNPRSAMSVHRESDLVNGRRHRCICSRPGV